MCLFNFCLDDIMDDHTEFDPCFKCSLFYQKSNAAKLVSGKYYSVFTRVCGPESQGQKFPNQEGPPGLLNLLY